MQVIRAQAAAMVLIGTAVAGAVAAVRADVGILAVLFGIVVAVSLVGLWPRKGRRRVHLRPDLARWLDQVSAATGEPVEDVLDRSVSAYRASLHGNADG
jgi:hypothetical protein